MYKRVNVNVVANLQDEMNRLRYTLLAISVITVHMFRVNEVDKKDSEFVVYRLRGRSVNINRTLGT
jgi:hypothetical protein